MEEAIINEEAIKSQSGSSMNAYISMLTTPKILEKYLINHGVTSQRQYALALFLQHFTPFCQMHKALLHEYFVGAKSLNELCHLFIEDIGSQYLTFDSETMFSNVQDYVFHVESQILKILSQRHSQATLNILGFGLGDGVYEAKLIKKLLDTGLFNNINLYGFDPNIYENLPTNIKSITKSELTAFATKPFFDVIIARWVLHHTTIEERWDNLICAMNSCRGGADIIIVEEAPLISRQFANTYEYKLKALIIGIYDVIVNMGLHPKWFMQKAEGKFFLQYLYQEDFSKMESNMSNPYQKEVITSDYDLFSQHLIHYAFK